MNTLPPTGPPLHQPPPCPVWCVVDHTAHAGTELAQALSYELRECASAETEIRTLGRHWISAQAVRFFDPVSGETRMPEVRVGDDTLAPDVAFALVGQLLTAAVIAAFDGLTGLSAMRMPAGRIRRPAGRSRAASKVSA
jgi:hypothetical protein